MFLSLFSVASIRFRFCIPFLTTNQKIQISNVLPLVARHKMHGPYITENVNGQVCQHFVVCVLCAKLRNLMQNLREHIHAIQLLCQGEIKIITNNKIDNITPARKMSEYLRCSFARMSVVIAIQAFYVCAYGSSRFSFPFL